MKKPPSSPALAFLGLAAIAASVLLPLSALGTAAPAGGKSIDDLKKVLVDKSNTYAKYEPYYRRATQDGYLGIAHLFFMASKAQLIHTRLLGEAVAKAGPKEEVTVASSQPKSTKENMEAALKELNGNINTVYPAYLKRAAAEKNADAQRILGWIKTSDEELARLLKQALGDMNGWKADRMFCFCTACGYPAEKKPKDKCPSCHNKKEYYMDATYELKF